MGESKKRNLYLDGMMGLVVGDALGVPVEFYYRETLEENPVTGMREYGTHHQPMGTWSDDSSMSIATLDSLMGGYDLEDIMSKFLAWERGGEYSPFGEVFDIGNTTGYALRRYLKDRDVYTCGGRSDMDNGNGALMRILPMCIYIYNRQKKSCMSEDEAICMLHNVAGLTHNHIRSHITCGMYYFVVKAVIDGKGSLNERLQEGVFNAFTYYGRDLNNNEELNHFRIFRNLDVLKALDSDSIHDSGYVVEAFKAAIWSLLNTSSYEECLLKAVNLGDDTDTVGAIAGGIAGLYYGYDNIPKDWLEVIQKREWLEELMNKAAAVI